jgi:hypothetical protein
MRRVALVLLGLLLVAGCARGPRSGLLTGSVTYKGQPVNGAALFLHPVGGSEALLIPVAQDGTFSTADIPQGEYKVVVQGTEGQPGPPTQGMSPAQLAKASEKLAGLKTPATIRFPDKYKAPKTTPLTMTVRGGEQTENLELTD